MKQPTNRAASVYGRAVLRGGEWTFDATAGLAKGFSWGPFRDEGLAVLAGAANACCLGIELLHPELIPARKSPPDGSLAFSKFRRVWRTPE